MPIPPKSRENNDDTAAEQAAVADLVRKLTAQTKLGHYDELRDATGKLRPAWQTFFGYLGESGIADLRQTPRRLPGSFSKTASPTTSLPMIRTRPAPGP